MTKKIVNILCLILLLCANLCKAEVRIALIVPKTGEYKVWGDELVFGAQTAVNELNAQGGINGKKLELITIDDTCSNNLAISTAQMLSVSSSIKPSLVIGPYCSNSFNEVAKIYSKANIFQIVPTTLNYHDSSIKHKGVMKLVSFQEQAGKDFFEFYNKRYAGLKTAIVYDNDTDGAKEAVQAVIDEFRRHGKSSLLKTYDFSDYDNLDTLSTDIVSSGYEIVYILGTPKKTSKIIRKATSLNKSEIFFVNKLVATESFFENAAKHLNNVYFMALPSFENNTLLTEKMVNLRLNGVDFEGLNIYGYAAVEMWSDLVKETKSLSYNKLAVTIQNPKYNNTWKNTFFNNTIVKNPLHYKFYRYQNNEYILSE